MNFNSNLTTHFTALLVGALLVAGRPALVAEDNSSPAPAARARITALSGTLHDAAGQPWVVGNEIKVGDLIKVASGETASLVLTQAGTSSSIICIQPGSEVSITRLVASSDTDYPLLDAELSLRNPQVRSAAKRVF